MEVIKKNNPENFKAINKKMKRAKKSQQMMETAQAMFDLMNLKEGTQSKNLCDY